MLKLLNSNFLYNLHSGPSEWHETQVTTSPWAPKALCKMLADYHSGALFILKDFISSNQEVGLTPNLIQLLLIPT